MLHSMFKAEKWQFTCICRYNIQFDTGNYDTRKVSSLFAVFKYTVFYGPRIILPARSLKKLNQVLIITLGLIRPIDH